ncbi:MAG: HAD-IIIC family phosphatase, partial [Lachnospiraceae bacterium]|nr:HAD-IIIC family phosphatase [Lachnospiraceae bacterium]
LQYPFDSRYIIKKKKSLKRQLLDKGTGFIDKKIAVLGGSTTHDIIMMLELFLLDQGIRPEFYECEYAQYWEDVMFDNPELKEFAPDIIYIHTSNRNIRQYPALSMNEEEIKGLLDADYEHFEKMWGKIENTYHCPVIQNNFEYPFYRMLGNADATDIHGRVNYINRLNAMFAAYARDHKDFFIQDINYLSAAYGLDRWSDPLYWHMYKYSLSMEAIPTLSYNLSNIIKSIYGKNKKALALDLDNTLWGGIVGDDGVEGIEIGPETSMGQVYSEFQGYLKDLKDIGVILNVCSKNEEENAIGGLNHPDGVLKPDDFIVIKANWDPKSKNLADMAGELNLLPESFVFVDDNPAEREIVRSQLHVVSPEIGSVEDYIRVIDHSGFFEVTNLSADDAKRNEMYKENAKRAKLEASFDNYGDYLKSLEMKGTIKNFEPIYMERIAQLSNKSNQFNLTTRRYTRAEIEEIADSDDYIDIYGKLEDKFGDNGVVSVVIGHKEGDILDMDLWIMSCRVLKRDMEYAMMDELVHKAGEAGIRTIRGHYYPTAKNKMVKDFYALMGFTLTEEDSEGNRTWEFKVEDDYEDKNHYISVNQE